MERNSKYTKANVLSRQTWMSNYASFSLINRDQSASTSDKPKKNALSKRDAIQTEEAEKAEEPVEKKDLKSLGRLNFIAAGKANKEASKDIKEEPAPDAPKPKSNSDFKNLFKKK
jgi:hypothetical protein